MCGRPKLMKQVGDLCIDLFGDKLAHFVWVDSYEIIVNMELHDILEQSELTGFNFRNVKIDLWERDYPLEELPAPTLYQLVVKGNGGSIFPQNISHSLATCRDCGYIDWEPLDQIKVDKSQWDGTDIFNLTEFPGFTLVTEKFCTFLTSNHINEYRVIPSEEFSMKAKPF